MKSLWPRGRSASGTFFDGSISGVTDENVQDIIDYILANLGGSVVANVNTFIGKLVIEAGSKMTIYAGGLLRIVKGTTQKNILIGSARINSNNRLEIYSNSVLQIKDS